MCSSSTRAALQLSERLPARNQASGGMPMAHPIGARVSEDTSAFVGADEMQDHDGGRRRSQNFARRQWSALAPTGEHAATEIRRTNDRRRDDRFGGRRRKPRCTSHYVQEGQLRTVAAKYVIMATPKFITARLVSALPDAQHEAMMSFRYCPYPVINMIFESRFTIAPTTPGAPATLSPISSSRTGCCRNSRVTCRKIIFSLSTRRFQNCIAIACLPWTAARESRQHVLQDFQKLQPEFSAAEPIEVRMYRRGHPMYLPAPGIFTKVIPVAKSTIRPHRFRQYRFSRARFRYFRCGGSRTSRGRVGGEANGAARACGRRNKI